MNANIDTKIGQWPRNLKYMAGPWVVKEPIGAEMMAFHVSVEKLSLKLLCTLPWEVDHTFNEVVVHFGCYPWCFC